MGFRVLILLLLVWPKNLKAQDDISIKAQYRKMVTVPGIITGLTFSRNGLHMAFSISQGSNSEVFIMGLQDKEPTQVTISQHLESNPKWSPDATKIAYQKDSSGLSSIWVYDFTTQKNQRITAVKENTFDPSWAPNGEAVAFSSDSYGSVDVMIKEFGKPKERRLTASKGDEYIFGFHPKGQFVGYIVTGSGEEDVYAVALTGKEAIPVTRSTLPERHPRWSYSGNRVLFYHKLQSGIQISTADFPYGEINQLSVSNEMTVPIISGDGKYVIYHDDDDLYIQEVGKSEVRSLGLTGVFTEGELVWSPNISIVAFSKVDFENETSEIWLVNVKLFVEIR
ncbi:MAG: hypothetical protein RJQ09_16320 [Cyclobacteriaceae bacterium]